MNSKIITKIEEELFALHPEVKPYYKAINLIKEMSEDTEEPVNPLPYPPHVEAEQLPVPVVTTDDKAIIKEVYSPNSSLQKRVLCVIKEFGRFIKANEIISKIQEYEPQFSRSILPVLTQLRLKKIIKNYLPTNNRKITYWGLTEWEWEGNN